jgi:hypothetical protein
VLCEPDTLIRCLHIYKELSRSGAGRWSGEAMAATRNYSGNPTFPNFAKFLLGPALVMLLRIAENTQSSAAGQTI